MKVRPTQTAFGCFSLAVGVEVICAIVLVNQIIAIAICSSAEPVRLFSLLIQPWQQVFAASWAFVGIPVVINAGVSVLYRVELACRVLFWYLMISFFFGMIVPVWLLLSGSLCNVVVDKEVQEMGSSFVCGFTDAFVMMWSLLAATLHAYLLYIVWSAAEDIARAPYPELMRYSDALRNVKVPEPPKGSYPLASTRAIPGAELSRNAQVAGSTVAADKSRPPSLVPRPASVPEGAPQSFFPYPASGADFSSGTASR
jgi:hypothetical protein